MNLRAGTFATIWLISYSYRVSSLLMPRHSIHSYELAYWPFATTNNKRKGRDNYRPSFYSWKDRSPRRRPTESCTLISFFFLILQSVSRARESPKKSVGITLSLFEKWNRGRERALWAHVERERERERSAFGGRERTRWLLSARLFSLSKSV